MKIILKKLVLKNFKGAQHQEVVFDPIETFIMGMNGSGKSTIEDAWSWLITGKDKEGNQNFGIKPTDANGKTTDKLDNEVTAVIECDGQEIVMRKTHKEKWTKPRGSTQDKYEGNEIIYEWQASASTGLVKVTKTVFTQNIDQIIPVDKLGLLTNVRYFLNLDKKTRRGILVSLAGEIDLKAMLADNPRFATISDILTTPSLLVAAKASSRQKINDAKKKLAEENTRIDENKTRIGGLQHPFDRLRTDLAKEQSALDKINSAINNKQVAYQEQDKQVVEWRKERNQLQALADAVSSGLRISILAKDTSVDHVLVDLEKSLVSKRQAHESIEEKITELDTQIKTGEQYVEHTKAKIAEHEQTKVDFRQRWSDTNSETLTFKEDEFCCPTCNREFEPEDKLAKEAALKENFNNNKAEKIKKLREESEQIKQLGADLEDKLSKYSTRLVDLKESKALKDGELSDSTKAINEFETAIQQHKSSPKDPVKSVEELLSEALSTNEEFSQYNQQIGALDKQISDVNPIDTGELIEQKKPIEERIAIINTDLQNEKQIKDTEERIKELQLSATQLAQQIADEEKKEFLMQEFDRMRMDEVEKRVNEMFSLVRFQMFSVQENGEVIDDCLILCKGKNYDKGQWNSALTINCGIDIINTLSSKQGIYLPIMVDNRESTTNIIESKCQIINLVVSEPDKVLRVEKKMILRAEVQQQEVVQGTLL